MPTMGEAIRRARKRRGFTQGQLADYAGVNRSYVSQIETGYVTNVGCAILVKIARCLDVSTDHLLGLTRDSGGRAFSPWDQGLLEKFSRLKGEHRAIAVALLDILLEIASKRSARSSSRPG